MSRDLGFGKKLNPDDDDIQSKLQAAAAMKPTPLSDDLPTTRAVERIVESQDGTIRQIPIAISRKRPSKGIVQSLNMRVRIATHNRFVELSKALRLPYDETLEALLEAAGVDEQGRTSKPLV